VSGDFLRNVVLSQKVLFFSNLQAHVRDRQGRWWGMLGFLFYLFHARRAVDRHPLCGCVAKISDEHHMLYSAGVAAYNSMGLKNYLQHYHFWPIYAET